jgi:hypothetical protein
MDPNQPTTIAQIEAIYSMRAAQEIAAQQEIWHARVAALEGQIQQFRTSGAPP